MSQKLKIIFTPLDPRFEPIGPFCVHRFTMTTSGDLRGQRDDGSFFGYGLPHDTIYMMQVDPTDEVLPMVPDSLAYVRV